MGYNVYVSANQAGIPKALWLFKVLGLLRYQMRCSTVLRLGPCKDKSTSWLLLILIIE